jgi:Raf kinase inhibitor-like YbhB/YbcL family protein
MPLTLISPAFSDGEILPDKYSRGGGNISPPLKWTGVPESTASFALLVEDPDAPVNVFRHWGVFDLPAERRELPESVETGPGRHEIHAAMNDFGNARYDGPDPPPGDAAHTYRFRLAALRVPRLDVPVALDAGDMWAEARKHAIEEAQITGRFSR